MTAKEAIDAIQIEGLEINGNISRVNEFFKGLVTAEEALEKQDEKKPILVRDFITIAHCPVCKGVIAVEQEWCDKCGQKIDWGD